MKIEKPEARSVHNVLVEVSRNPTGDLLIKVDPYLVELNSEERIEWTLESRGIPSDQLTFAIEAKTGQLPNEGNPADEPGRRRRGPFPHPGGGQPVDGAYNVVLNIEDQSITIDPGYRIYP